MIKLILLDLDGTLMSPDHLTVSEKNRIALKKAHDMGVKIGICTGRTLAIIGDVCEQVPEVDYIIYSNGAGVYDGRNKKPIYAKCFSWEQAEGFIDYILSKHAFIELYVSGKSFVEQARAKYFGGDILPQEFIDSLLDKMEKCDDIKRFIKGNEIEKITLYPEDKALQDEMWAYFSKFDNISLTSSLPCSMEMTREGVDKGTALASMCEILGITAEECMTFGDAGNDIPMLEYAKYSFAMENGSEACKKAAKYQTKSNAESGVAFAINEFILKK